MVSVSQLPNRPDDAEDDLIFDDETELEEDESGVPHARYGITSYGVDFDVRGLVRRLQEGDITIPVWQRGFVWTPRMASSFIESLLLGLPVPGIFVGTDPVTQELYVVDGQQRLRTLRGFYEGKFPGGSNKFALTGVTPRLAGTDYDDLADSARRALDNSLIHATVVRQDSPANDDTSMYQIFKRLNSGGRAVNPQEIRRAVYQGKLMDKIEELNADSHWRSIVGERSPRLKDHEMILRFMAMLLAGDNYSRPMEEFLNVFTQANRNPDDAWLRHTTDLFERTVAAFADSMGTRAFRRVTTRGHVVNAAIFDSMSVGLAKRIEEGVTPRADAIRDIHNRLVSDEDYLDAVTTGTSDARSVNSRLSLAKTAFEDA